jgi:hypothetical protein
MCFPISYVKLLSCLWMSFKGQSKLVILLSLASWLAHGKKLKQLACQLHRSGCSRGDEEKRARSRRSAVPSIDMVSFFVSCLHPSSSILSFWQCVESSSRYKRFGSCTMNFIRAVYGDYIKVAGLAAESCEAVVLVQRNLGGSSC